MKPRGERIYSKRPLLLNTIEGLKKMRSEEKPLDVGTDVNGDVRE